MVSFSLLVLILALWFSNVLSADDDDDDDDMTDLKKCMPQLADSCFRDVYSNLECHIGSESASPICINKDVKDLCSAVSDSLSCASDIVDDCSLSDGRDKFDSWMQGLQAVYEYFCKKSNESLKVMVENKLCWNSFDFIMCVERTTKVTHVVDLLQVILDVNECNRLLIALSNCNVRASPLSPDCYPPQEVISEVIHTFFSQTKCGSVCASSTVVKSATIITLMSVFTVVL